MIPSSSMKHGSKRTKPTVDHPSSSSTRRKVAPSSYDGIIRQQVPSSTPMKMTDKNQSDADVVTTPSVPSSGWSKSIVSSLGPVSLVGGTAAIYTSLLDHPNSTLTNMSFIFMMLLAIQYALQPRLSRKYISPKINNQSVALVEEVVKTGMAAAIFFAKPATEVQSALKDWSLSSSLAVAGLPAMLYALQGVLQYVSYQYLDPVTFNGLTQTKTLSAAFCCWVIVHQPQSPIQIVALAILLCSALVFQGHIPLAMKKAIKKTAVSTTPTSPIQQSTTAAVAREDWIWRGVVPCLGAAFLSGLAGALSQKGLQLTGIRGRDPFLYTIEISFFSAVTLLFNMVRSLNNNNDSGDGNTPSKMMDWQKQKAYWNWKTFIPIVVKATGGVITALVHKYAGSVSKGFALMFGLVLSNMIQLTMHQDSQQLQPYQVVGTIMIMLSTWMHFTNPPI